MLYISFLICLFLGQARIIEIDWKATDERSHQDKTAAAADVLNFVFSESASDVVLLNSCDGTGQHRWDSFTCPSGATSSWGTEIGTTSSDTPVTYSIPSDKQNGDWLCFVSTGTGNCEAGQHLSLKISGPPGCQFDDLIIPDSVTYSGWNCSPGNQINYNSYCTFYENDSMCGSDTCKGIWEDYTPCRTDPTSTTENPDNMGFFQSTFLLSILCIFTYF